MNDLTQDQIRCFIGVADQGSFSAAARALQRTQPALSQTIRHLEQAMGTVLFDRSGYRPVLTETGHMLLPHARRMLEDGQRFHRVVQDLASGVRQTLAVAADACCPSHLLVDAINRLRRARPKATVTVHVDALDGVVRRVMNASCEIGIASVYSELPAELSRQPLLDQKLFAVASASHPLAKPRGVRGRAALRRHVQIALIDSDGGTAVRDYAIMGHPVLRTSSIRLMLDLIRSGLGYGFLPEHLVANGIDAGELMAIDVDSGQRERSIPNSLFAIWQTQQPETDIARLFVRFICAGTRTDHAD